MNIKKSLKKILGCLDREGIYTESNMALKQATKNGDIVNPLTKNVLSAQAALNESKDILSKNLYNLIVKQHLIPDDDILNTASNEVIKYLKPDMRDGSDIDTEFWIDNVDVSDFIAHMLHCPLWSVIYVIKSGELYDYWIIVPNDSYETYSGIMTMYNEYVIANNYENMDVIIFTEGQLDIENMPYAKYRIKRPF